MSDLSESLKLYRANKGWSLSQAADAIGITKPHLWELEDGRSSNPTIKTLSRIAAVYSWGPLKVGQFVTRAKNAD